MSRIVRLLIAAVVLLAPFTAVAAFSLQAGYPQREGGGNRPIALPAAATGTGTAATPTPIQFPNTGFSRGDCFDQAQNVRISLVDIPAETTDVEIWVRRDNTSCADPANRTGGANVQCWRAARWIRDDIVNKIVTFKPIQVIQAIDKQQDINDASGLDPNVVCAKDSHMTPVLIYLQIMAFNSGTVVGWSSGTATAGAVIGVPTAYDLAGPNPPSGLTVGSGNKLIVANFSGTSQPPADFDGYKVYCFPGTASGTGTADGGALSTKADDAALSDGGTVDDASEEDTSTTTTDTGTDPEARGEGCPSGDPFVAGELPSAEAEKYVCNSGNATASGKITVSGLQNGVPYAVAIAARDKMGNSGVLSTVQCTTPKETDDFFTVYNRAGGTAGGGWCAIGTGRGASFGLAGFAVALAFLSRIARRSRR